MSASPAAGRDAVIFGVHAVRLRLRRHPETIEVLHVGPGRDGLNRRLRELLALAEAQGIAIETVDPERLDRWSEGERHQGVLARLRATAVSPTPDLATVLAALEARANPLPNPLFLVLDGVQDPHNLGACMRSAAAAGAHAVVVPRRRAAGMGPVVQKVASGAAEVVPLVTVSNLARALEHLAAAGVRLVGASASAPAWHYECDLAAPLALILGGEAAGLRRLTAAACDELVAIPMPGPMESLNVSVSAGVLLFEAVRQRALVHGNIACIGPME